MFAMARSSYEINAGLDLTPVLNRRLLKNLAKEIDAPPRLLFKDLPYIDKSMQIVLERGSIDKPLTFNIGLLQLIFHTSVFT